MQRTVRPCTRYFPCSLPKEEVAGGPHTAHHPLLPAPRARPAAEQQKRTKETHALVRPLELLHLEVRLNRNRQSETRPVSPLYAGVDWALLLASHATSPTWTAPPTSAAA